MKKPVKATTQTRVRRSPEYREEALRLAEKVGIPTAAKQLGLHESQLYGWRSKSKQQQTISAHEQRLEAENARLKRQLAEQAEELAILKKAATYFAKHAK